MKLFAIGDLHLNHMGDKPMDVFGSHWDQHMTKIQKNWQEKISEEDIILVPGDISWAMRLQEAKADLNWLESLPGQKICIRGNHDYWWDRVGSLNKLYEQMFFLQNTAYKIGDLAICGTRGWTFMEPDKEENIKMRQRECIRLKLSLEDAVRQQAKEIWVMLHYPPTADNEQDSAFVELMKQYPVTKVIYGHLHDPISWQKALIGTYAGITYHLVAADYLNFDPLLLK